MQLMPWKQQRPDGPRGAMTLRDAVNQLFDESLWDPFSMLRGGAFDAFARDTFGSAAVFVPNVDVSETGSEIRVVADVPGYDPKHVNVRLEDGVLTIEGAMETEHEEKDERWHRREASRGSFVRRMSLPSGVTEKDVSCAMKNGKLTVTVRKPSLEKGSGARSLPIATE